MEFLIVCAGVVALIVCFSRGKKPAGAVSIPAPTRQPENLPGQRQEPLPTEPFRTNNALPDGKYVVRFVSEKEAGEGVRVDFEIAAGPHSGSTITLDLNNRKARQAVRERKGDWIAWLQFEGDAMGSAIENARSNAYQGHFEINVKGGQVTSVPEQDWERLERKLGRSVQPGHQPEGMDLADLAIQFGAPLDVGVGSRGVVHEGLIPVAREDGTLVLKKPNGRKPIRLANQDINWIELSPADSESWESCPRLDDFIDQLRRSPLPRHRRIAVGLIECAPGDEQWWPAILELAKDPFAEVRCAVADGSRSWTTRVRKTVMKKTYSMLESNPDVLSLLVRLSSDPDAEVRLKACYALGDHPNTSATSLLDALAQGDPSEEVRKAAAHARARLYEFEKERWAYENAVAEKAGRSSR